MLRNRLFFALASRSGFGATISSRCEVWSVKKAVGSEKCEVWSVKFKFGVRRAQCEVWSVRFGVWRKQWEVRSVKCGVWSVECEVSVWSAKSAVWSVKCEVCLEYEGSSEKWEVWNVECEVWSVKFQFGVRRAQCEVWSVKCEVWSVKEAVRSEKCEVWSVECEVWSLECEECSVKCGVWSVKTLLRLSLKKSNGCRGKDTVGTGCLWTIGHLCLGNFRRRLARVYVTLQSFPEALKRFSWPNRTLIWAVFKTMSSLYYYNGWFRRGFPLIFPNWSWLEESPIKHHSYSCVFDVLCLMVNQLTSHGITMESPYHKWW